jgi:hypothetical protein
VVPFTASSSYQLVDGIVHRLIGTIPFIEAAAPMGQPSGSHYELTHSPIPRNMHTWTFLPQRRRVQFVADGPFIRLSTECLYVKVAEVDMEPCWNEAGCLRSELQVSESMHLQIDKTSSSF